MPGLRIVLADDHARVRLAVRSDLEDSGFVVCAEAADADGAVEAALRERPDLCLLDVQMPGSGIVAAERIAAEMPDTPIVMLTVSRDDENIFAALRAGASGYLLKDVDTARLPGALGDAAEGEPLLSRGLYARVADELCSNGDERLSLEERALLTLLRSGSSVSDAADELGLPLPEVRDRFKVVLRKLRETAR